MILRSLTSGEIALARGVFDEAIPYATVRLLVGAPLPFAVTLGPLILFPATAPEDFADADVTTQAWLVHELVHVWQWRTRPLRTLASWAKAVVTGGYGPGLPAYRYTLPLCPFETYGLEQQASIVEHAFLLRAGGQAPAAPKGASAAQYASATPFPSPLPRSGGGVGGVSDDGGGKW